MTTDKTSNSALTYYWKNRLEIAFWVGYAIATVVVLLLVVLVFGPRWANSCPVGDPACRVQKCKRLITENGVRRCEEWVP